MTGRVDGKIALMTGGASGLAKAAAEMFVAEGGYVVIGDVNEEAGAAVVQELGDRAAFQYLDVTSEDDWVRAYAACKERFGGVHVVLNSAGIGWTQPVTEISLEDWRRVHAIDLDGVFLGCKHGVPAITETIQADINGSKKGSIVNISSIAGNIAGHNMAAYNSAKAAVRHLTKSVALHCCREGFDIRCNSVHPTFVDTPILNKHTERFGRDEAFRKLARQVPIGRVGEPKEVAYAILYLASDESSYTTGSELLVDGGISAM
jgi:3(or 17)beta-hydroxysteroid dehydrogenase